MKTVVISAVNIRKGGTLSILNSCLSFLSTHVVTGKLRVVALVHSRSLCDHPGIEYIEMPQTIKGWGRRLWCEYVTMGRISKRMPCPDLWFSLHDTTPRVRAKRQAVYCQTSFPFLKWRWRDLLFDPKIVLFALFTRFAYQINIRRNSYLVVQAEWLRRGFSEMFSLPQSRFIVAPPQSKSFVNDRPSFEGGVRPVQFIFAATPDCHKNFELICRAAEMLEAEIGVGKFSVVLTISGQENRYAKWLYRRWGSVSSVDFVGFLTREKLYDYYVQSDCLIFPSRIETWGLPISEFATYDKPMLLADLPYAYETAAGCRRVAFFDEENPKELKELMLSVVQRDESVLRSVATQEIEQPAAKSWDELFRFLLS